MSGWSQEARAAHSARQKAWFASLPAEQRQRFIDAGRRAPRRSDYASSPRVQKLILTLRVLHDLDMPKPRLRVLAQVCGFGGKAPDVTVCQRIGDLIKRGCIPAEWWRR